MFARKFQIVVATLLLGNFAGAAEKVLPPVKLGGVRREPVAATFWNDDLAVIACAKSGSLIFWDVAQGEIKQEFVVGKQLRGVVRFDQDELLAIDDKTHELIQLRYADEELTELKRIAVPEHPVSLIAWDTKNGPEFAVASLWSRQVTVWHRLFGELRRRHTLDLPFEPRRIIPDSFPSARHFYVIAAFGGKAYDVKAGGTPEVQQQAGDQFVHMVFNREFGIFATRQTLSQTLPLTRELVSCGNVMQNELQTTSDFKISLARAESRGISRNDQNADPAGIAFTNNAMLVCLSGVDQVWYRSAANEEHPQRLSVGKRPRTIITNDNTALVLGELDDTITRIETKDPDNPIVSKTLLDPAIANRDIGPAERGERLFFDARMSAGGMLSCHSCHTDGHTNGLLADTLGDNTHGTPKRVLTLRGTRLTDLWGWNGEMKTLQDNVFKSLQETMHAPQIKPADVDDLVSFLHTLPPVPPLKPVPRDDGDRGQVARGEKVFLREDCAKCHIPPLTFTSHAFYDVGLSDEKGLKKFNPPSLRGVGRLRKLFHDNRANGLRDVFETHGHQLAIPLPAADLDDLIRYLEGL